VKLHENAFSKSKKSVLYIST